jgi:hypothetical protein
MDGRGVTQQKIWLGSLFYYRKVTTRLSKNNLFGSLIDCLIMDGWTRRDSAENLVWFIVLLQKGNGTTQQILCLFH